MTKQLLFFNHLFYIKNSVPSITYWVMKDPPKNYCITVSNYEAGTWIARFYFGKDLLPFLISKGTSFNNLCISTLAMLEDRIFLLEDIKDGLGECIETPYTPPECIEVLSTTLTLVSSTLSRASWIYEDHTWTLKAYRDSAATYGFSMSLMSAHNAYFNLHGYESLEALQKAVRKEYLLLLRELTEFGNY